MFTRPNDTYDIKSKTIEGILRDAANPLNQIVNYISNNTTILDIGAGNGLLARLFQEKQKNISIDGIEPNIHASKIAKQYYRNFFNGYLDSFTHQIKNEKYDYIILADVIEHVVDPLAFIEELKDVMGNETKLIFSIPNVAFGSIRLNLLFGNFEYTNSGILEKTHLRFYTESSIKKLMKYSQLNIENIFYLHRSIFATETSPFGSKVPFRTLCQVLSDKNANVYQFLVITNNTKNSKTHCIYKDVSENKHNACLRVFSYKGYSLYVLIKKIIKRLLRGNVS